MAREPVRVTTRMIAPSPANWLLRTTVIITTDDMTPAMGSSECSTEPALPSGRLGGASMVRGSGAAGGRVVRAGRWISRVLIFVASSSSSSCPFLSGGQRCFWESWKTSAAMRVTASRVARARSSVRMVPPAARWRS